MNRGDTHVGCTSRTRIYVPIYGEGAERGVSCNIFNSLTPTVRSAIRSAMAYGYMVISDGDGQQQRHRNMPSDNVGGRRRGRQTRFDKVLLTTIWAPYGVCKAQGAYAHKAAPHGSMALDSSVRYT